MSENETDAHVRTIRGLDVFKSLSNGSGGKLVKTTGDGAMLEFASATAAVKFGLEVQTKLIALNQDVEPDRRPKFRIGIHLGEIMHDGGDIYGHSVNIATRIEQFAE